MICPNCRCFIANNSVECNYCGKIFYNGSTRTVPVNEGSSRTRTVVDYSMTNPVQGSYSRTNTVYMNYGSLNPAESVYPPNECYYPKNPSNYGKTPRLEKVYTSYTRPGVTYEVYSYDNSINSLDIIYGMIRDMNRTNKLLMIVAICLALIVCLMLLLII